MIARFTMSDSSAPRDMSLNGLFSPKMIGPISFALPKNWTSFEPMFAASRFGKTRMFALPPSGLSGAFCRATAGSKVCLGRIFEHLSQPSVS